MGPQRITVDANEAVASVAHRTNEVIVIYPITPSSPMGEWCDEWSACRRTNLWGQVPDVVEMQSEAGAIAAIHGALQAGSLATTFTASQGLLLMVPNLYKIAGELNCFCMHVAARTVAAHALSIFGDQSDVMAVRQTGFALLCSNSVQEAHDFALIGQAATLRARVPFLHFFDGFRTSHEVAKIAALSDDDLRAMLDEGCIAEHRRRALTPDRPVLRGTAQNPDAYFQAREACNPYYDRLPGLVQEVMDQFAARTGRRYRLFDYFGDPQAERVLVLMGSGVETARETVDWLAARGEKVGVLSVRLYRPFSIRDFVAALPATTRAVAVLDRTKEPGAVGEPLYQDVVTALAEAAEEGALPTRQVPRVIGGRYGLSSKEFTPAMVKSAFDELAKDRPRKHFTVGIVDDVTRLSLPYDDALDIEVEDVVRAVFFGLGADGTVGANKNSIKIIGEGTDYYAQGYFVYDSKKSGATTVSHLRFGPRPIRSAYLVRSANFVACHQFSFLEKLDVLGLARPGGVFLLNAPYGPEEVWGRLPRELQEQVIEKRLKFHVIDAMKVARDTGMGGRINTIMQTCFFAVSGVLPREQAVAQIKKSIQKTYGKKGEEVVRRNFAAVDHTLAHLYEVAVPERATSTLRQAPLVPDNAPDFVKRVTAMMMAGKGDLLPVSAFPVDGTWPLGTTKWEKRTIADEVPVWDAKVCIQCNKCALVCPHAAIRAKVYDPAHLQGAPEGFQSTDYKAADFKGWKYTIQVAPEDCTGCNLCVGVCPAKDKSNPRHKAINMTPLREVLGRERANYDFFLKVPDSPRDRLKAADVKGSQFLLPLFEYSGACAGCGETPYLKLLTQLFGDRLLIGNATGCSSIYGGNLPTTPYTVNPEGRGPAWSNSLFEDTAEFGLGFRLSLDSLAAQARRLLTELAAPLGDSLVQEIRGADQKAEPGIDAQRQRVAALRRKLAGINSHLARRLELIADYLVEKSVWLIGGDGWAYDIGYGGLDHVLSLRRNVNALVLDTEVYSNTGGQASKSTPLGAAAKFAAAGKETRKKDLGLMAMSYGHVYVASVAFGAKDSQTVQAFQEAASYDGPSLIIAYSHCIAHGYDLRLGAEQQKLAVGSGAWPLYRYDPRRVERGEPPLVLDAPPAKFAVADYMRNETRFRMVEKIDPQRFRRLAAAARDHAARRVALYEQLSHIVLPRPIADCRLRIADSEAIRNPQWGEGGRRMNLATSYMGFELAHPLVPGASPLVDDLDTVRRLEDAGAPMLVMHSLFEEQVVREELSLTRSIEAPKESYAEALSYFPDPDEFVLGPDEYLEQVRKVKAAVSVPVVGSLNGTTEGGWLRYARLIEQAGADALELNLYELALDPAESGEAVERRGLEVVRAVKAQVKVPVAVKLSPFYSSLAHYARRLDEAGADALVLFNRFYQPDIDVERQELLRVNLSSPAELLLRVRWIGALAGRVRASLAATGGVHTAVDVVKAVMAGAHATQMVSALLRHGPGHLRQVRQELALWLEEHEFESLRQMQGSMSLLRCAEPGAYLRANYIKLLQSWGAG